MNYNNPYGYANPYNMQYPQYQQPQVQVPNQPQINQYTYVNGIEGAKSFQVQPGKTVLLVDNDNPFVYFKTANDFGQSSLRYFTITEIDEGKAKTIIGGNQLVNSDYASKSDLDTLSKKYDDLSQKINTLLSGGK